MIHSVKIRSVKAPKNYPRGSRKFDLVCSSCGPLKSIIGGADSELSAIRLAKQHEKQAA